MSVQIVLVDDDPDEHFLFREDLEDAGMDLDLAAFTHAGDALEHLRGPQTFTRSLVLTDLSLAGDAALEFIRNAVSLAHVGAVGVYSGAQNPDRDIACRAAGSSFYIVKPMTVEKLELVVADVTGIRIARSQSGRFRLEAH